MWSNTAKHKTQKKLIDDDLGGLRAWFRMCCKSDFTAAAGKALSPRLKSFPWRLFSKESMRRHFPASVQNGWERLWPPIAGSTERSLRLREPVIEPDVIVIQDPTLLHGGNVLQGLASNGYALLNSSRGSEREEILGEQGNVPRGHFCAIPATDIARRHLNRPLPNIALLGALAALTGIVQLESVTAAIRSKFGGSIVERNAAAAAEAFAFVRANANGKGEWA